MYSSFADNFRKYKFLEEIRGTIRKMKNTTTETLIHTLTGTIQGWPNHYRHHVAKATSSYVDIHSEF
ncbi:MAG: group II intron maturase-specific domain-containing protein [Parachlamydiaceae bacterium]